MEQSLISVIVPVYNVEAYLRRCLDSIINQTYKNLEIILIDDGSTDKSGEICEEYRKKDKRIIVIHQKNQGLSAARNTGLDIFKGEYVSFIDSDDYVDLRFIEKLYAGLVSNNADVSVCSYANVDEKGKIIAKHILVNEVTDYRTIHYIAVWTKLYKKFLLKDIKFPVNRFYEDSFVFYPILKQANRISCLSNCLYYYNGKNKESISNTYSQKHCVDLCEGMSQMLIFAGQHDVESKLINEWIEWSYSFFIMYYEKYRKINSKEFKIIKKAITKTKRFIYSKLYSKNKVIVRFPVFNYRYGKFKNRINKLFR